MAHKEKRIDVRVYLTPDEHEYLKAVAQENELSLSELLRTCTLKKCKFSKTKKVSQKLTLPSTAESTEQKSPTPEDIKQLEKRLVEVNTILNKAYKGEKLPMDQYHALKAEQADLRAKVGHN